MPRLGTPNRAAYPVGWLFEPGNAVTFLARAGTHDLHFITGVGATIELAGRTYRIEPAAPYRSIRVIVPETGPATLRCVSGALNLDRMELRE